MSLEDVEENIEFEKITHEGISIWPVIKSYLIGIVQENNVIKQATVPFLKIFLKNLPGDLWSLRKILKSEYWVFSSSQNRFHINENSFDRVTTGLLRYVKGYTLFENPIPKGRTKSKHLQQGEHYIGMSWIYLLQFLILKLSKRPKIENLSVLESYLKRDVSKIGYIYHRIQAGKKVYSMLFKVFRPKVIFVVCYYSNFELILAAKQNGIPVIELQHGLITDTHRAYHFARRPPELFLPDYFFSYGKYATDIVVDGNLFKRSHILDYGYSFIEEAEERLRLSPKLKEIKDAYSKTICITGQLRTTDIPLLDIISKISNTFPNICFIFKPRHYDKQAVFPSTQNFIRIHHLNTYELLKYCDYHLTVYSTCALEALALGTPNIAVDIDGLYTRFLKKIVGENPYNFVANTEDELVEVLYKMENIEFNEKKIKNAISHVFSPQIASQPFFEFVDKVLD